MIIVQITGGLGNQMFQYALGRSLSLQYKTSLKLDVRQLERDPLRKYALHHFALQAEFATPAESNRLATSVLTKFGHMMQMVYPGWRIARPASLIIESPSTDPAVIRQSGDNHYFSGLWQSEDYFRDIADAILHDFSFRQPPDERNEALLEQINASEAISVHIRRTDYVTDQKTSQFHGLPTIQYYLDAAKRVIAGLHHPAFFVFSDDIGWAKANLVLPAPTTFVDINDGDHGHEDLRLMSQCQHHIIANSTFSWWGAWLAPNPTKQVIAPKVWAVANPHFDIVPPTWTRI